LKLPLIKIRATMEFQSLLLIQFLSQQIVEIFKDPY
jgi:hypothetical protein